MNIQTASAVKELQTRICKQEAAVNSAREEMDAANKRFGEASGLLGGLRARLKELTTEAPQPTVTEHALLRYCERMYGIDLEKVKADILTPATVNKINALKSCKLEIGPGVHIVVKQRVVVTVEA